jgi:hypothetical protein
MKVYHGDEGLFDDRSWINNMVVLTPCGCLKW